MKKALLFLLIVLPFYLSISLFLLDKDYFLCPIEYKRDLLIRCDSRGDGFFASRRSGNRVHQGIDLFAGMNSSVLAARSGRVIAAGENRGMGKYVVMRHPDKITTVYGHLAKLYVSRRAFVRQGEIIGEVGKTGNANYPDIQPHLHFEVRKSGIPQDPLDYLQ